MKLSKYVLGLAGVFSIVGMLTVNTTAVHALAAPAPQTACKLTTVGTKNTANQADSRFTLSGNTVSADVMVTGPSTCQVGATLTTWEAPDANKGLPYDQQTLFAQVSEVFTPGKHTIAVAMPDCFYQVDLTQEAAANPHVGNSFPNGTYYGSLHGGTQACTPTPPPSTPPVTPTPPASLPNTGSGLLPFVGALGIGVIGAGLSYFKQLKKRGLGQPPL